MLAAAAAAAALCNQTALVSVDEGLVYDPYLIEALEFTAV